MLNQAWSGPSNASIHRVGPEIALVDFQDICSLEVAFLA